MDSYLLLKGIALGFSIAAPVGPIGILCIQRTLDRGRLAGFVSGLGAATADTLYGLMAVLGIGFLNDLLIGGQAWLRLFGGVFLIALGSRLFFKAPPDQSGSGVADRASGYLVMYTTIFVLTISNPMTILAFSAVMTGLGVIQGRALVLVLGVFLGSTMWWMILALGAGSVRSLMSPRVMAWINRLAGAAIVGFGLVISVIGIRSLAGS